MVYNIPLSCGKRYVGQTGRCLNDRLREHDYSLRATVGGHLATHCKECACSPLLEETSILGRHKDKLTREVLEAYYILSADEDCISVESVALTSKERDYLKRTMKTPHEPRMPQDIRHDDHVLADNGSGV